MARQTATDTIRLTGRVLDWNETDADEALIQEKDKAEYEAKGYSVSEFLDKLYAVRLVSPADGDITIQPKTDMYGRMAMQGGHTNWGFSGYFRGYVYLKGERKRLVDFWALLPTSERTYATRYAMPDAEEAIRAKIELLSGTNVVKVRGGYAFDPDADAERQKSRK